MDDGKKPKPALAIAQAAVALILLIGLPLVFAPSTDMDMAATGIAALVLLAFLVEGVMRFLRSRRPSPFLDSVMPPKDPPRK